MSNAARRDAAFAECKRAFTTGCLGATVPKTGLSAIELSRARRIGQHNGGMPSLESSIDSLYQAPLDQFVAERQALAKTLAGDEARQVKQLPKPTVLAWAVNQVYWRSRGVYDRLIKSGKKLRSAQVAALSGRSADLRAVGDEHRAAVTQAVAEASRLAVEKGAHPSTDELSRTFEALSLEVSAAESPGRLTKALQPAGFEALAGIVVKAAAPSHDPPKETRERGDAVAHATTQNAEARRREQAAQRQKEAAIKKAAAAVELARRAEDRARAELERLRHDRESAEAVLARLQDG